MEIRLSPELAAVVEQDMASGRYRSVEEYIAEAVEMLHERQQWRGETLDEINAKLDEAVAEAERGELISSDELRRNLQANRAQWSDRRNTA
jgi:putative addiction module CopG family antidote